MLRPNLLPPGPDAAVNSSLPMQAPATTGAGVPMMGGAAPGMAPLPVPGTPMPPADLPVGGVGQDSEEESESSGEDSEEGEGGEAGPEASFSPYFPAAIDEQVGRKAPSKTFLGQFDISQCKGTRRERMLEAIGKRALELITDGATERLPFDREVRRWMRPIYMTPPDRSSPLGEDGSNLRTSVTCEQFLSLHAFWLEVTTGVRPYIRAEANNPDDVSTVNKCEDYFDSVLTEDIPFAHVMDQAIAGMLEQGTVFLTKDWTRTRQKRRQPHVLTPQNAESLGFTLPKDPALHIPGTILAHASGTQAAFGQTVEMDSYAMVKNQPQIRIIPFLDYVQYPANAKSPDTATLSGYRYNKTIAQMRLDALNGVCDVGQLTLIEENNSLKPIYHQNKTNILRMGDEDVMDDEMDEELFENGLTLASVQEKSHFTISGKRYVNVNAMCEFVEFVMGADIDGDGLPEDYLCNLETSTGTLTRFQRYRGPVGVRPLRPMAAFQRFGKLYGMPLGQILDGLQQESDTSVNMALDGGALNMTSIVEILRSSNNQLISEELGVGMNKKLVDSLDSFKIHNFQQNTQDSFRAAELAGNQAQRLTGVNETLVGQVNTQQQTTARETESALMSNARRLKVGAERIQLCVREIVNGIWDDIKDYAILPGDNGTAAQPIYYSLSRGDQRIYGNVTESDLNVSVKWFPHGDTINTNQALQLQGAEKEWMISERSPFITKKMARKWQVEANVLREFGVREVEKILGTLEEAQQEDEQNAKAPPPPTMPQLPPGVDDQFMAMFCAMNDNAPNSPAGQTIGAKYLYYFGEIEKIKGAGKAIGSGSGPGDPQTQQQLMDAHAETVKAKLGEAAASASTKAQLAQEKAKSAIDSHLQDASHNLDMQRQDAAHEADNREQQVQQTAATAATGIAHTAEMERQKTANAEQAAKQKAAQNKTK